MTTPTTQDLRRRALALNIRVRRRPDGGYTASGSGAPGAPNTLIACDEAELHDVLLQWLGEHR